MYNMITGFSSYSLSKNSRYYKIVLLIGGKLVLEVLFSDSEKGSMKTAKHLKGKAVEGNSQDVVNIGFLLDIGDISGAIDGNERQNVFRKVWGRFYFEDKEQEQFFQNQYEDMEKLMSAAKDGIPIRVWKSNAPYSMCGFYYVCNLLRGIECNISVVSLPKHNQVSENEIVEYSHWGEVSAGDFYQFLSLEKQVTQTEKRILSNDWNDLMLENAPLRAIINGKLTSVPENFYDFIIANNLPDNDFIMAQFIGKLLGKYRIGISDSWYAYRIDKMIEENKLIVIENKDTSHPYGKVLRKNTY